MAHHKCYITLIGLFISIEPLEILTTTDTTVGTTPAKLTESGSQTTPAMTGSTTTVVALTVAPATTKTDPVTPEVPTTDVATRKLSTAALTTTVSGSAPTDGTLAPPLNTSEPLPQLQGKLIGSYMCMCIYIA